MKRRTFLRNTSLATLPVALPGLNQTYRKLLSYLTENTDKILVLIQCSGGYDGLNMVLPLDQYEGLSRARANLLIPETQGIKLTDQVALHPALAPMAEMFREGQLQIIQGVGYPEQNRSHFRSTDIWTSGSASDQYLNTGWLGRYLDDLYPGYPEGYPNAEDPDPFAITMQGTVSETCQGIGGNFSMSVNDPFALAPLTISTAGNAPDTYYGDELAFLRDAILKTNQYSDVIQAAAEKGKNQVSYPENNDLANQLRNVALLISGGLQTRIYVASMGGYDTHANQITPGDATKGAHADLMEELSSAIAAFQADLNALGYQEKVLGMTFTEFGRRIRSNYSLGTDHGSAAPLFLFGSCVEGSIVGHNPEIPDDVDPLEGVALQHDFRNIYGSLFEHWFEIPKEKVGLLLYPEYQSLPILKNCSTATSSRHSYSSFSTASIVPNPIRQSGKLVWEHPGGKVRIQIMNVLGSVISTLYDGNLASGPQTIELDTHRLIPGTYYIYLMTTLGQRTLRMVKL